MIVADIVGALGNQLFSYAATKSIALDLGYEYRYRVVPLAPLPEDGKRNTDGSFFIESCGHEYNEYFEKAFHIDTTERVTNIPLNVSSKWTWSRSPSTNFNRDVYNICDETHVSGFFLCPKYFEHRRAEVLSWFRFRAAYRNKAQKKLSEIKAQTEATHLVGLHFRYAKDIQMHRLAIDPEYYRNAIKEMRSRLSGERLCFILFSDVPDLSKELLKHESDIILHHGTTFEDLCLMTLCDSHIISNSTFSWWGAWLSESTKGIVIRPSIWPIGPKYLGPEDIFPSPWISVDAKRQNLAINDSWNRANNIFSSIIELKIKQIRRLVKKLLKKLPNIVLFKKELDMNTTYSGATLEKCSYDELKTQISHLSHNLDKTINTLPGLPEFGETAEGEIRNLINCLEEWNRRSLDADRTIDWANELMSDARALLLGENELEEAHLDLDIYYNKAEEIFDLIRTRRSIRNWQNKKIPEAAIETLLEAATWAPSACNRQSVRYVVLKDDEQKMALVKLRENFLGRAPVLIFIGADSRNYYSEEVEIVPYLDAAVATQNILLMAHAMGLGAVMVKCTNVDIKMDAVWSGGLDRRKSLIEMYSKLNLPDYFLPVAIVALGYPKRIPKASPRLPKNDVRYFERFIENTKYSNLKSGESTKTYKFRLLIIKVIHRIVKYLGIRIYITLD